MEFGAILVMPMCWLGLNRACKTGHGSPSDSVTGRKSKRAEQWLPNYRVNGTRPGGLVKTQRTGPHPRVAGSVGLGPRDPSIGLSSKLPGDADGVGPQATLGTTQWSRIWPCRIWQATDKSGSTAGDNTFYSLESHRSAKGSTEGEEFILPAGDRVP